MVLRFYYSTLLSCPLQAGHGGSQVVLATGVGVVSVEVGQVMSQTMAQVGHVVVVSIGVVVGVGMVASISVQKISIGISFSISICLTLSPFCYSFSSSFWSSSGCFWSSSFLHNSLWSSSFLHSSLWSSSFLNRGHSNRLDDSRGFHGSQERSWKCTRYQGPMDIPASRVGYCWEDMMSGWDGVWVVVAKCRVGVGSVGGIVAEWVVASRVEETFHHELR